MKGYGEQVTYKEAREHAIQTFLDTERKLLEERKAEVPLCPSCVERSELNSKMTALHRKYGRTIDVNFYPPNTWNIWVHGWHRHWLGPKTESHGSFSATGCSIEDAIARLHEQAAKIPPNEGDHCREGSCPNYWDDGY